MKRKLLRLRDIWESEYRNISSDAQDVLETFGMLICVLLFIAIAATIIEFVPAWIIVSFVIISILFKTGFVKAVFKTIKRYFKSSKKKEGI